MSRAERDKGARGEREVAAIFRFYGFDCHRVPNSGGLHLPGDLYGNLPLHVEVKRQETARPWAWWEQASSEADDPASALVAFRRSRSPWLAIVHLETAARMLAAATELTHRTGVPWRESASEARAGWPHPRYIVGSVTGFALTAGTSKVGTSYHVMDSWYAYRVVFARPVVASGGHGHGTERRRRECEDRCAELNAAHDAWLREVAPEYLPSDCRQLADPRTDS